MRPIDIKLGKEIEQKLVAFDQVYPMPGIRVKVNRECFIEQIIDSIRRIKYVNLIRDKNLDKSYTNPENSFFDPLKAASWHRKHGNLDEAFWLIFLAIHFGKNKATRWELVRNVYKGDGNGLNWTWKKTTKETAVFRNWLHANNRQLKKTGNFGNHRKYESLNALGSNGTGEAIETYINWVGLAHDHMALILGTQEGHEYNRRTLFNLLYNSMDSVIRFGRTAKFDYLTMVGKLGLYDIEPDSTYMVGSTGPYAGANLLFSNSLNQMTKFSLDQLLIKFENHLGIYFGMQVLEDALCNWQKSPQKYIHFTG
jgi:Alpha-glutamyl/putrescinyl thymine pyrophosphorylase clade 3